MGDTLERKLEEHAEIWLAALVAVLPFVAVHNCVSLIHSNSVSAASFAFRGGTILLGV